MSTVVADEVRSRPLQEAPNLVLDAQGGVSLRRENTPAVYRPYACRAWARIVGNSTPASLAASGNVSSLTDMGVGDYQLNFATPMPDATYCTNVVVGRVINAGYQIFGTVASQSNMPGLVRVATLYGNLNTHYDATDIHVFVHR